MLLFDCSESIRLLLVKLASISLLIHFTNILTFKIQYQIIFSKIVYTLT